MFYLEKLEHLLVMEKDAKSFKVYDAATGKYKQTVPEKKDSSGGSFIAADYCEVENTNFKFVATTSNNNSIDFWDPNNYIKKT